jgi:hypothetical protein
MHHLDTVFCAITSRTGRCSERGQGFGEYVLMAAAVVVAINLMDTLAYEVLSFFEGIAETL